MQGHAYAAGALPRTRRQSRSPRSDTAVALLLACACAAAMFALWALAEHVFAFELRDATLLHDSTLLDGGRLGSACKRLLHLLDPTLFTIWGVALVLIALARGRARVALAVVALLPLAPLSAELLKPALAHPHLSVGGTYIGAASWPSGHATAATALALSAVLVTSKRFRPIVVGCALPFVLAVGFALLVRGWHMPSDVLGGYLLGSLWTALVVACLRASEARWPRRARDGDEAGETLSTG
jgi:membrane-associated phospholipid phosphatase